MPDVTIWDISAGVQTTWAAVPALVALIPATSVYLDRQPEGATLPYATYSFKDVSAYFGGTEYFTGRDYVKFTQISFKIYGTRAFDWSAMSQAISNAFGWSDGMPEAQWDIPHAEVLSSMPETESIEVLEERVAGEDAVCYSTGFTVMMQADRG